MNDCDMVRKRLRNLVLVIVNPVPDTGGSKVVARCIANKAFSIVDDFTGARMSYKKNDPSLVGAQYILDYELVV